MGICKGKFDGLDGLNGVACIYKTTARYIMCVKDFVLEVCVCELIHFLLWESEKNTGSIIDRKQAQAFPLQCTRACGPPRM